MEQQQVLPGTPLLRIMKDSKSWLPVKLTEHEIIERSKLLAAAISEKRQKEDSLAQSNSDAKEAIKGVNSTVTRLAKIISAGSEDRNVDCKLVIDLEKAKLWYEFNNEKYCERAMSNNEVNDYRQRDIADINAEVETGTPKPMTATIGEIVDNDPLGVGDTNQIDEPEEETQKLE